MDDAFLVRDLSMSFNSMVPVVTMDGDMFDQLPIPNAVVQEKTVTDRQTNKTTDYKTDRQTDIINKNDCNNCASNFHLN